MTPQIFHLMILVLVSLGAGGLVLLLMRPYVTGERARDKRLENIVTKKETRQKKLKSTRKEKRRKQLQEMLHQVEEETRRRQKRQRPTLKKMLRHAGLRISPSQYYLFALGLAALGGLITLVLSRNLYVALGGVFVGGIGIPLWLLNYLRKRRELAFLSLLPETIDAMIRSLKAGLPLIEALKLVAKEMPDPIGPEFREVVEGQKIGIPLDQGFQRMYDRMPLPEVNFLAIVISVQQRSGGNLSEILGNLAKVLRDRKKMRLKVKVLSQEAKAGAAIIGSLPFIVAGAMSVLNPEFIQPMFTTKTGMFMILGSLAWMGFGVVIMYKMINFKV